LPNLATVLREEIRRLARRELRRQTGTLAKSSAQYRRDIAALKRRVSKLEGVVDFLNRQERRRLGRKPPPEHAEGARFSAKGLRAHRARLGLSAKSYGRLLGVTGLTVYNWESGRSRPRPQQLAAIVALRGLGKREAVRRLELLDAGS
jgi:DNA-binding transcriptional regulator YiaG